MITFSDKEQIKAFIASKPALQGILNDLLQKARKPHSEAVRYIKTHNGEEVIKGTSRMNL